jgi:plastocyanin
MGTSLRSSRLGDEMTESKLFGGLAALRRIAAVCVATALVLIALAAPGNADEPRQESFAASGPVAQFYGYLTPVVIVEKGGALTYANFDLVLHDFVHLIGPGEKGGPGNKPWCKSFEKGRCPLFWSKKVGLNQTVSVQGLGAVKPGATYTFYCTLHSGMKGTLVVAP